MNFEFDFYGIDRLFSLPLERERSGPQDWIIVPLLNHHKSWLLLQLDRSEWKDESAALELANTIGARKLAECDGLSLGSPRWMDELQKRQVEAWTSRAIDSGEGRWANGNLPGFRWYLITDGRAPGEH